jgi:hypothetical protein
MLEDMNKWLGLVIIVAVIGILLMLSQQSEGFIDVDTAHAQSQQLKWEGDRRYNEFALLQNAGITIPADDVDDAVRQNIPVASSFEPSRLAVKSMTRFGAADDGTNKQGDGVEKTGILQQKITFCESVLSANCDILNDPRYSECGICHKDGVNSKGKPHRGGMFISADDQVRANEVGKVDDARAIYKPTIGTCSPANFTVMTDTCIAKERTLECERAGAATSSNECGQCFGGGDTMLYVGPKSTYQAVLHVSHPGLHNVDGVGMRVTQSNGRSDILKASSTSAMLDPKEIYMDLKEGDTITIVIYGVPAIWCAWLSNPDGTRTVSLDIGVKSVAPAGGLVIAGDKRSKAVTKVLSKDSRWNQYKDTIPNTVMLFQRKKIPAAITRAMYGPLSNPFQITEMIQSMAGYGQDIRVKNLLKRDPDDDYSGHYLTITQDTGSVIRVREGDLIPAAKINNTVSIVATVPASLRGPYYDIDQGLCAAGPMVFTEIGAGIMGANSCYDAKGKFNPSVYCLTKLFEAVGGTSAGTLYPDTPAKALALVVNGSLDATVDALNNRASIAMYGVDNNGAPSGFEAQKKAAVDMMGLILSNPCDGPTSAEGPHSEICLDYLWRTSGNTTPLGPNVDPASIPYAYCSANGEAAPLKSVAGLQTANDQGGVQSVRSYFSSLFNRSQDSSDYDAQAEAMKACYGVNLPRNTGPPACPPIKASGVKPCDWIPKALRDEWRQIQGSCYNAALDDKDYIVCSNGSHAYGRSLIKAENFNDLYGGLSQVDSKGGVHVGVSNFGQYASAPPIYKATQGTNWTQLPGHASWVSIGVDGELWCIGGSQTVYRWNGAPHWVLITGWGSQISVGDKDNVYMVGMDANLYKASGNNAQVKSVNDWILMSVPVPIKYVSVSARGTRLAVLGTNGNIYASADKGGSWTQIPGNFDGYVSINDKYIIAGNKSNSTLYLRSFNC